MTTKTYLRVKRRRSATPASSIRLEGLGLVRAPAGAIGELTNVFQQEITEPAEVKKRSCAVWRRVPTEPSEDAKILDGDKKRAFCVVDAILEGDDRSTKRRKLTLVETTHHSSFPPPPTSAKTRQNLSCKAYPVLDPLSRLVDDSLQMSHSGDISVAQHYSFITTDPRVAPDSRKWMAWCNASTGNILHACARWSDAEIARDLLQYDIDGLTEAVDGDGCTPYETARLYGHDTICQVLESFGGDSDNFVYDIFYLQDYADEQQGDEKQEGEEPLVSLELRGGVGYWTEDGELVLEATPKEISNDDEYQDDIDSNCEDYGGNDYPDEDELWEEDFLHGEDEALSEVF